MGLITLPTDFSDGTVPTAAQFDGNFNAIVNEFNGNIENANIASDAAIALSKLATGVLPVAITVTDGNLAAGADVAKGALEFLIDGGGTTITTGLKGGIEVPFNCTITAVRLGAIDGLTGAIVVDVWKDTYANFPPTDADSITASAVPTITATGNKSEDTSLVGWTTSLAAGDWLFFNVDSVTTLQRVLISLTVTKT